METKRPTPIEIDEKFILKILAAHITEAEAQWKEKNPHNLLSDNIKTQIRKKVVRKLNKDLDTTTAKFQGRFAEDLYEENDTWPRSWMVKDRKISKRLGINPLQPQGCMWAMVWSCLWEKSGNLDESNRLAQFLPEKQRTELQRVKSNKEVAPYSDWSEEDSVNFPGEEVKKLRNQNIMAIYSPWPRRSESRSYALFTMSASPFNS